MINKENLQLFTHEKLRYKVHVEVESWGLTGNSLQIIFATGHGEIVSINKFNEWFVKKREEKINKILNESENSIF